MFNELVKYTNKGSFIFKKGDQLSLVSKDVPRKHGVYYVLRMANTRKDLVYIGKAGTIEKNGECKKQCLRGRINNKQDGINRQSFLTSKMNEENIDTLEFCWFVTYDDNIKDLPGYVEGLLIQKYFEVNRTLPEWNKCF
ncbi:MAG: hypothetical protein ACM3O3_10900 [Syntrophothermus sp.]